jgi:hypothetical protein
LLVAAPFSWDAGHSVKAEPWWPINTGIAWGLPLTLIGVVAALKVWWRSAHRIEIFVPQLSVGIIIVFVALVAAAYASFLPNPDAYGNCSITSPPGNFCAPSELPVLAQRPMVSWVMSFGVSVPLVAMLYVYLEAIGKDRPSRFDRRDDEVDAIGSMLEQPKGG